jgi:hypothetical protein
LFSKTPVLVTDNTHTCGFNHVSLNARLRVDGDRRSAQVSFSFAGKDTFAVNRIVMKTPLNGVSCNSALLQGKKADESWETIKEINFDSVVDVDTTKSFPEWRFINFGGDVSGACDIDGIVIDGRVINDSDMANLGSDYSSDNSRMRCSVCHACYLKCGRYSDANRYRFKACVGTESECKRQVLNTDIDGEVTFAGDPFASAITSLKVGSYLWSGIRQYTKHNRMKRRLLRFENKKKFSLRLTGLNFNHFVESDDAKLAASSRIARSLGVSLNQLKINSVRKGSVIIDFEVIREENEEPLDFSSFVEDHKNGVLESSLKEAMASISGVDSNELKVAELSNIMEHNERNLVTAPNLEDWQCYLERYDDIIDATETGAYQHWIKYGDEEGRLWGCFDGYFDSTENLQDFVFTTDVAKQYNSISMKPNLRLFISESIAARGGFLYLKTFEKATETKRKRKIDMPLYYTIVSGNDEDIFKIDHATGQIAIKSAQKLNRGLKSKYQLSISSSDLGGLSSVTTVEITVLESNDPPTAFDATFNIPENLPGVIIGSVFANDTDITMGRQQSLSYKIIGGDPLGFFSINPISGAVSTTVGSKIDFESVKYYELIVQVSDDGPGKLSDTASISVVISDVNENPVFPKAVRYVVENTPVDYIGNGAFLNGKGVENERGSYDGISLAGDIIRCGNGVSTCGTRNIRKIESIVAEEYIKNDYRGYILEFSSPDYNNVHKQGPREAEYRIHPRANSNLQQSGTFEACLYAKVSKDFDGIQQLISVRYYNTNNALIGTANGGFPNKRGIWEHVCVGFDSQSIRVSNFIYSAGYPLKNTRGNVKIFGISLNLGKTIGGPLSGFDIDAGDSLTYNLLSKNTPFEIRNGNKLAVTKALNYERQHLYILNIEAVDKNGLKG